MNILTWRVFSMALLLAMAVAMPTVVKAQDAQPMNEIQLGSGSATLSGSTQPAGNTTSLELLRLPLPAQPGPRPRLSTARTFGWQLNSTIQ